MEDYTVTEVLREGTTPLYRGIRNADGKPVLVKTLRSQHPSVRELERLQREQEIRQVLGSPYWVEPSVPGGGQDSTVLVAEDLRGQPLQRLLGSPMPPGRFLELATSMAATLARIHGRGVIHHDIQPQSFLVNPLTGEMQLADFELASLVPREHPSVQPLRMLEGSLAYMSPEQTGRMNRAVDARTDLYSLGVTFYEMLTGVLPFEAQDALEWVHCHIARLPLPPGERVPELPEVLSDLVMRLLAKAAEERYQSARGVQRDLERCLEQWRASGRIEPFVLGRNDVSERFQVSQKLYGREEQAAVLLRSFERVVARGTPELVLVSGYAGIGKSSLVHELHRPLVSQRGLFLSGKFGQYKQDIPYAPFVHAFRTLVRELLAESPERVAVWRTRLQAALAPHGRLIVDMLPEAASLLGEQPPLPELPLAETQARFQLVLHRFLRVFCDTEHPLVLFLDDLQWADAASLRLLQHLLTHPDTTHLLVIGAYRDNEVSPTHPLTLALEKLRKAGVALQQLVLTPLTVEHLVLLVADTLHCRPEQALPLARLVHQRTAGNPFFTLQVLTTLHQEQLLTFDAEAGAWRWDLDRIQALHLASDVVALMVDKLRRLPEATQEALKLAACVGNRVDVHTLSILRVQPELQLHGELWAAVREGLVLRQGEGYQFVHDRVQQAAYSLMDEQERSATHLRIGRLLLADTPAQRLHESLFDIVNQLNQGAACMKDPAERERLAKLDLLAGRRAKESAAYAPAASYLAAGMELLPSTCWETCYELTRELYLERSQCEYLCGRFQESEALFAPLLHHARTRLDAAATYIVMLYLYMLQLETNQAVTSALECLRLFGIHLMPHPSWEQVLQEYERVWEALQGRQIEELLELPPMADPETRAILDVLVALFTPALFTDKNLYCLVLCQSMNLSLRHGHTDSSSLVYVFFGCALCLYFQRYKDGYRFGRLGYELMEARGLSGLRAKVMLSFSQAITPWTRPLAVSSELMQRAFEAAVQAGDVAYAGYSCNGQVSLQWARGEPLEEVHRQSERMLDFVRRSHLQISEYAILPLQQLVRSLQGRTARPGLLDGGGFDEAAFEERLVHSHNTLMEYWYSIRKLQARFMAGAFEEAVQAAHQAKKLSWVSILSIEVFEYELYAALALAAQASRLPPPQREPHLLALREHVQRLDEWARNCPENFLAASALVSAEAAWLEGRLLEAESLYEQAVHSARENHLIHLEALGYELASRFYRERGLALIADTYLGKARACYVRWGANAKVEQIDRHHPHLVQHLPVATHDAAVHTEQLDLLSVTKASQSLSREIVLPKLQETLLRLVCECAGAQRGCLLLVQDEELSLQAEAEFHARGLHVHLLHPPLPASPGTLPLSLLHQVMRLRESIILDDAGKSAVLSGDVYLEHRQPRSVLCLPILRQDRVVGLLYLENNLTTRAFTPDKLTVVEVLAAQAAISLENAALYRQAQEAIQLREDFLSVASHELRTPLTPLRLQLQRLEKIPAGPQVARMLTGALSQVDRLEQLVESLLDVSQITSGGLELHREPTALDELVREVVARMGPLLKRSGSPLELNLQEGVVGLWDRLRMEQVMENLLTNAIKFGKGRPITLLVEAREQMARMVVKDQGIGIAPEHLGRIFGRFERAVSTRSYGGLGLGLYIARQIVEAHEGTLRVESQPDRGSTFTVELPLALHARAGAL